MVLVVIAVRKQIRNVRSLFSPRATEQTGLKSIKKKYITSSYFNNNHNSTPLFVPGARALHLLLTVKATLDDYVVNLHEHVIISLFAFI